MVWKRAVIFLVRVLTFAVLGFLLNIILIAVFKLSLKEAFNGIETQKFTLWLVIGVFYVTIIDIINHFREK